MALTLPTFSNIPDPTGDRILAAFTGWTDVNGNALTPVQAYRQWLRAELTNHVTQFEAQAANASISADLT